ncbi:pyridoxamine 5'-phosphate oxidase family protein [Bowmanella pacifica]|uniref:Pyridoxamine 5'-phosphate oxidase putative domain-containing protein n=1 Tax=Bowmanella pacifica TaxID=502051 RepID=A0A917Z1N2_9ALTE|nr:pyridoxamine 5'-phosphate oxidase family protein [Bowmanella pacifica]GGO72665.1 hypothetical protein GCM10010982_31330 [Bowmanella pacifica]
MDIHQDWPQIRRMFARSFSSSSHYAIASIGEDGLPHVTPIGSLILTEPGKGVFFEKFTRQLPLNLSHNANICVLAVNSGRWFWLKSLLRGGFDNWPALRLKGQAGERREASEEECQRWFKRVNMLSFTKGYDLMWKDMCQVRELHFHTVEPVKLGAMTQKL